MKKNVLLILLVVFSSSFILSSCEKVTNSGPGYKTFYVSAPNAVFPVTITVTNTATGAVETGTIYIRSATAPECMSTSTAVYSVSSSKSGTTSYTFTAIDGGSIHNWSGTFTIDYGYCHLYELQQ